MWTKVSRVSQEVEMEKTLRQDGRRVLEMRRGTYGVVVGLAESTESEGLVPIIKRPWQDVSP